MSIIFGVTLLAFVALLALRGWLRPAGDDSSGARGVVLAAASAINGAGVMGLIWSQAETIPYDGVDATELAVVAAAALFLIGATLIALRLHRRGRTVLPIIVSLCGAIPTVLVYGVIALLVTHPTDMR